MSTARLRFAPSHPAFAGHFPGAPVVPGALLLAAALEALGLGGAGSQLASAKFLSPVAPDEDVDVTCEDGTRLELRVGDRRVATAVLRRAGA